MINNEDHVRQVLDFTGIQNSAIHPTDFDAVLEFDCKLLVLVESKLSENYMSKGQMLAYQRVADAWQTSDLYGNAVVLLVWHNYKDNKPIPITSTTVKQAYFNRQWHEVNRPFKDYLNWLGQFFKVPKCKFK